MGIDVIGGSAAAPQKIEKSVWIKTTGTWTCPDDVTSAEIYVFGGGGGGGAKGPYAAAGGGGGAADFGVFNLTPGQTYTVTIGAGGAGGIDGGAGASGSQGGTTSFGSLISITGGYGGGYSAGGIGPSAANKLGGYSGGGRYYVSNNQNQHAWSTNPGTGLLGLAGGGISLTTVATMPGVGGGGGPASGDNGFANTGGGGAGGGWTGGNGGSGLVILKFWSAL